MCDWLDCEIADSNAWLWWTVKMPIQMLGCGSPKLAIRMLGCGSPKLRSALCKAFNSNPDNEVDTAMFKSKRRLSSAENACAARRGKRKRSRAFPASPSAITGSLPRHATVRGRGTDVSPGSKAQIAVEYADAGGKASGAGRSVAAKRTPLRSDPWCQARHQDRGP